MVTQERKIELEEQRAFKKHYEGVEWERGGGSETPSKPHESDDAKIRSAQA